MFTASFRAHLLGDTIPSMKFFFAARSEQGQPSRNMQFTLTKTDWDDVRSIFSNMPDAPSCICDFAQWEWKEVVQLPPYEEWPNNATVTPHAERSTVSESYLAHLQEQIDTGARGESWSEVLQTRLAALRPLLGRQILSVMIRHERCYCCIKMEAESRQLVIVEFENN